MISREELVRVWQSSDSVSEIEQRTGLARRTLYGRISHLRRHGVQLKFFRKNLTHDEIKSLKKIAVESLASVK